MKQIRVVLHDPRNEQGREERVDRSLNARFV